MNKNVLIEQLESHMIDPSSYSLKGGHPSESYVLSHSAAGWSVYYSERGHEKGKRAFRTELGACRYMLGQLLSDPSTWLDRDTLE